MHYSLTQLNIFFDTLTQKIKKKQGSFRFNLFYKNIISNLKRNFLQMKIQHIKYFQCIIFKLLKIVYSKQIKLKMYFKKLAYIFLINCGGNLSLPEIFNKFKNQKIKLVLLDSHRPLHHQNVNSQNKNIIIIDDGHIDLKNCPQESDFAILDEEEQIEENLLEFEPVQKDKEEDKHAKALEIVQNYEENQSKDQQQEEGISNEKDEEENEDKKSEKFNEEDEDNLDEENGENLDKSEEKKNEDDKIKNDSDIVTEKEGSQQEIEEVNKEEDIEAIIGQKFIQRKLKKKEQRQRQKRLIIEKIDQYYSGNYCGEEISGIMYKMSSIMNKQIPDFLWYWILGLTDHCQSYRINKNIYQKRATRVESEVLKMNLEKQNGSLITNNKYKIGYISVDKKLDLILLPYWNLYDCLIYSNNTIPKLKTWHESGKNQIQELIVKLGIPLTEAQQQFKYLKPQYKQELEVKFGNVSNKFGFEDILTTMFTRQFDSQHKYSSFDFAFICNNILTCPFNFQEMIHTHIDNLDHHKYKIEQENLQNNFWLVYHEILNIQSKYINKSIHYSINYQTVIVDIAFQLLKKKKIKTCSKFYYVTMDEQDFESNIILSYLSLEKVANLLINIKYEIIKILAKQQKKKYIPSIKPIVICLFSKQNNNYFVLGSNGIDNSQSSFSIKKNSFGNRFKSAAEKVKARYSCDSFEASLIKIHKTDFENFLEALIEQLIFKNFIRQFQLLLYLS